MAAATAGYEWSRSSPLRSSPDTSSSMYPDRPIRPMPRRSLRARLSPEQADTIVFPHNPPSTGPLFNFPYAATERGNRALRTGENDHHVCHCGHTHSELESDDDDEDDNNNNRNGPLPPSPTYPYRRDLVPGRAVTGASGTNGTNGTIHHKTGSTASSVDGYESFENTNNKKKRKIPNMGSGSSHHAMLLAVDGGAVHVHEAGGAMAAADDGQLPGRYCASAPSTPQHNSSSGMGSTTTTTTTTTITPTAAGTGISGAGRGRFGRSASGRSERRVLGSSTGLANARASSKRPPEQSGIISTAIANAQATPPPPPGPDNVSLLQHEAARHSAAKTQFTFTCGSDSASKMVWPGQENGHYPHPPGAYPPPVASPSPHPQTARARPPVRPDAPMVATQGTQTSPNRTGPVYAPAANRHAPLPKSGPPPPPPPPQQPVPPPRKPRRSAAKLYEHAARKRQIQQEYANFHNPPSQAWICEFCEYEDIFGHPPRALIRQYEIKDRKERKRLAEKRRLLEKARMKGRKGKKASKKAQNNVNNGQHAQNPPLDGYARRDDDGSLDAHDDDDYYDDYDDAPPVTHCPHGCQHHPHPPHPPAQKVQGMPPPRMGGPPIANGA